MPTDRGLAVAFAGTPDFAVPSLDAIAASRHRINAVFTQPDRPSGRGRHLAASPVKERALALGLPVRQPATLKGGDAARAIASIAPDVMVVVAYGLLLPPEVLALPRLGCLNVHASLLPRWRGAAPVARAILAGDDRTGVCIMRMEAGLDTGPVMLARATTIGAQETAGELEGRLARVGGAAIVEALDALAAGRAEFVAAGPGARDVRREAHQGRGAPRLARGRRGARAARARVEPAARRRDDARRRAASHPRGRRRVRRAGPGARARSCPPGADGIVVMAGEGALALRRVQLPGRRAVGAGELANARALAGKVLA